MKDIFNDLVSDFELSLRMKNLARTNNKELRKPSLDIGLKLQRNLRDGVKTPIKNDDLEVFLGYGITQAQKYLEELEKGGIISIVIQFCPKEGKKIPHYTLAPLPELTLEQIDRLIDKEGEDFIFSLVTKRSGTALNYRQIKKMYQEYDQRIDHLEYLRDESLKVVFSIKDLEQLVTQIRQVVISKDIDSAVLTHELHTLTKILSNITPTNYLRDAS